MHGDRDRAKRQGKTVGARKGSALTLGVAENRCGWKRAVLLVLWVSRRAGLDDAR